MKRWMGLVLGLLLGAATAGAVFGVWRWVLSPDRTSDQWLADLRQDATVADRLASRGEAGLEVLLKARESQDITIHRRAVRGLAKMGEAAAKRLAPLLPRARGRVEVPLVALGAAAVPAVEELLANDETAVPAARVLGMMGERGGAAQSALIGLLQDPTRDANARAAAALALGQIGEEDAIRIALASSARNAPILVRREAIRALGLLGQAARPAVPALRAVLDDQEARLRDAAAQVLGDLGVAEAVPKLADLAAGNDLVAADALVRMGRSALAAFPTLLSNRGRTLDSLSALRGLGPGAAADLLAATRKDTREAAYEALLTCPPLAAAEAIPWLEQRLDEPEREGADAAAVALALSPAGHDKAERCLAGRLRRDARADLAMLLAVLQAVGAPGPIPALSLAALKPDDGPATAASALAGASNLSESILPDLRNGTKRDDVGNGCLLALPAVGAKASEAMPDILAALERPATRLHAAVALSRIAPAQSSKAMPAFREALEGPRVGALARLLLRLERPPPALLEDVRKRLDQPSESLLRILLCYPREDLLDFAPDLAGLLAHRDDSVRSLAARLLRHIGPAAAPFVRPLLARKGLNPEAASAARDLDLVPAPTENDVQQAAQLLGDPEPERRALGAAALANAPSSLRGRHADALAECLFDPDRRVRELAARALSGHAVLREAMHDGDPFVRVAVDESLLPDKEAALRLRREARLLPPTLRLRLAEKLVPSADLVSLIEADARAAPLPEVLAWLARHGDASAVLRLAGSEDIEEAARRLGELGAKGRAAIPWLEHRLKLGCTAPERAALKEALTKIR